jgi:hypothetical protein
MCVPCKTLLPFAQPPQRPLVADNHTLVFVDFFYHCRSSGSIVTLNVWPANNCKLIIAGNSVCGISSFILAPSPWPDTDIADWIGGKLAVKLNFSMFTLSPQYKF